jgi:hypothetical protein
MCMPRRKHDDRSAGSGDVALDHSVLAQVALGLALPPRTRHGRRSPDLSANELRQHYSERFYFGGEAADVMTAWAFDRHGNHRLRRIFSSDAGHFDVVDMTSVLEEAHEMVEHRMISNDDLREFVFTNPARLHTAVNPDFFAGTVVEAAVQKELAKR